LSDGGEKEVREGSRKEIGKEIEKKGRQREEVRKTKKCRTRGRNKDLKREGNK
jgi:hypothetical protein